MDKFKIGIAIILCTNQSEQSLKDYWYTAVFCRYMYNLGADLSSKPLVLNQEYSGIPSIYLTLRSCALCVCTGHISCTCRTARGEACQGYEYAHAPLCPGLSWCRQPKTSRFLNPFCCGTTSRIGVLGRLEVWQEKKIYFIIILPSYECTFINIIYM